MNSDPTAYCENVTSENEILKDTAAFFCSLFDHSLWRKLAAISEDTQAALWRGSCEEEPRPLITASINSHVSEPCGKGIPCPSQHPHATSWGLAFAYNIPFLDGNFKSIYIYLKNHLILQLTVIVLFVNKNIFFIHPLKTTCEIHIDTINHKTLIRELHKPTGGYIC